MEANGQNQDDLILKQQEEIQQNIAASSDLVSEKLPLKVLEEEFSQDEVYKSKIAKLSEQYSEFRRIRPDGNCFFRAVGFRLFEWLLGAGADFEKVKGSLEPSKDQMVKLGMPEFTVEDFYDTFMATFNSLSGDEKTNLSDLLKTFNDEGMSNYLVVFLRLLTSKQLQLEGEFYQNFMEGGRSVAEFCNTEVEPMYKESDHIHIIGLTAAASVGVRVVYLDRGDSAVHHDFPEDTEPQIHVLYRPGHYDILYLKAMEVSSPDDDVVVAGRTVVLQKFNYMRTHLLNPSKNLQLGRDLINLSGIVGQKYGTTFKMVSDHENKKCFKLEVAEEVSHLENLFMPDESGEDNRDLQDGENQKLSRSEIDKMREDGVDGVEIVEKIIENSETFQNKTKFSQEKFLKKKAKKYHQYIMVRRPSIRLLMEINYKADPMKILNLRVDTLAQVLSLTNVHSGGHYLVYETGAQGLVVAAVLERVGVTGSVTHIYQTGQPQTNCLSAMNFPPQMLDNLHVLNVQHLRSLEQGVDILANHNKDEPPAKKPVEEGLETNGSKPVRMNLREKSVESYNLLKSRPCDGLIVVCKQHPANLLTFLSQYVVLSGQFSVFSPYKEPLLDSYMAVKEAGIAINVNLSESWLRSYQVLPERTHPLVNMSGGGGYLLTGIFTLMDGLSLLGLVCESKLQEKVEPIDVLENFPVKVEHLLYDDIAEEEEEEEEEHIEEDPSPVKKEILDVDDDVVLIQSSRRRSESFEKSSQAVATHLNIKDFGNFRYKIFENQLCKYSKYTGWHLQRSSGMMKIKLEFEKLKFGQDSLIVRALLVRKDETYRHYGVDRICENHRNEVGVGSRDHVLHPSAGMEGMWYFDQNGQRNSLCFKLGTPDIGGHLEATIGLKIMCNDSCSTCDDPTFRPTESSRDLLLLLTLETTEFGIILSRRSIVIWPKAVVRPKDLNKPERRKPKGGAAKLNKKKEMILKMNENKSVSQSQANQLLVKKDAASEQKKVNLIVPIETSNSNVTKLDIVNSSLDFTVRNARSLGISKDALLLMVEKSYDHLEAKS